MIEVGDKVVSNGRYRDIHERFGNTEHVVKYVGEIPSCREPMVWLDCGGGGFLANGFRVVEKFGGAK